jgi:hypothetical protein
MLLPLPARMKVALALLALLSASLLVPAPAAADAALPTCVNYAYAADYMWYYACYDAKDLSCPVYTAVSNDAGRTFHSKECVVELGVFQAPARCVLVAQDLDYSYYVCYAPGDLSCPVYTERHGGYGDPTRRCVGAA